jgi:hypothetical protein
MVNYRENYRDEASPFYLTEATLSSERLPEGSSIDVSRVLTDLDIYEDITKPFLTGRCVISDFNNIMSAIELSGDETLKLTIQKPGNYPPVKKTFFIDSVINSTKINDSVETYAVHLVEDVDYLANLENVNKSYQGKPSEIVKNIIAQYFPTKTFTPVIDINLEKESNNPMKVIIPNLNPVEAITWVKKNSRTQEGMPYFLFTALAGGDKIYYADLGSLLSQVPINLPTPFRNWQAGTQYDYSSNDFQIVSYKSQNTDNLYKLIRNGNVGATHSFYDTINGGGSKVDLDIEKIFEELDKNTVLSKAQKKWMYPEGSLIDKKRTSSYVSEKRFTYPVTKNYEDGFSSINGYNEEIDETAYRKKVIGSAISHFLEKNKMTVTVPGTIFLQNNENNGNFTVGNVASFYFMKNVEQTTETAGREIPIDKKRSGYYLITKTVHMFRAENYFINMDICKLQNIITAESDLA